MSNEPSWYTTTKLNYFTQYTPSWHLSLEWGENLRQHHYKISKGISTWCFHKLLLYYDVCLQSSLQLQHWNYHWTKIYCLCLLLYLKRYPTRRHWRVCKDGFICWKLFSTSEKRNFIIWKLVTFNGCSCCSYILTCLCSSNGSLFSWSPIKILILCQL